MSDTLSKNQQTLRQASTQRVSSIKDCTGSPIGAVTVNQDSTGREQLEEQLRLSEIRQRMMIEQSPLSIQIFSPDGKTLQVNRAWEELWGVTLDQIAEYNILEDGQLVEKGIMPYIKKAFAGEATAIPAIKYEPDKTIPNISSVAYRWVRAFIYPVKDELGYIREVVLTHEDITAAKQAEEMVQQSENRFRALIENNADAIILINPSGNMLYVSPSTKSMLGYDPEDLLGHIAFELIHPDDLEKTVSILGHIIMEGNSLTVEFRGRHKDGSWRWIEASGTSLLHDPSVGAIVGNFRDVTVRKQAEEALRELEQRKDEFISMASHELKTPITSLKVFTQMLQRRFKQRDDVESLQFLSRMDGQLNKLTELINDLLDISKMQAGKLTFREEAFDLDELVQEIVANIQETTLSHQLLLEGTAQTQLIGDKDRLGQVIINLLTNAIKYSPEATKVIIRTGKEPENIIVSVQDFGIGIPEKHHQKIFERFYQVSDTEGKSPSGLGIGLYISSEIIKRHHGRMWVENSMGDGATFCFALPLQER